MSGLQVGENAVDKRVKHRKFGITTPLGEKEKVKTQKLFTFTGTNNKLRLGALVAYVLTLVAFLVKKKKKNII